MQNNDQKGSLKDTFSEFGAAPTDGLWNAISDKLDDKKKRRFAFWWWSSGLAALLVVGFTVWNWNQPEGTNSHNQKTSTQVLAESTSKKQPASKGNVTVAASDSVQAKAPFIFKWEPIQLPFSSYPIMPLTDSNPFADVFYQSMVPSNIFYVDVDSSNVEEPLIAQVDSSAFSSTDSTMLARREDTIIHRTPEEQQLLVRVIPKKWEIGLFAGRSMAITQSNPLITGKESNTPPSMAVNPPVEIRYSWNADLTVSRRMRNNWWLGSGAHFGFMQSGNIPETSNYKSGKINYLSFGVPLSIGREFRIGGRFNVTPIVGLRYDYAFRKTEEYTWQPGIASISSADGFQDYSKTSGTAHLHLVSGFAAAEVKFRLRREWALVAKPMAQFYVFGQTDESTPNTFRNVWLSGAIGVTKRF